MKLRFSFILLSSLFFVSGCATTSAGMSPPCYDARIADVVSEDIARFSENGGFHGAVLVAKADGCVLFEAAYGSADDSAAISFSMDTAVDIGSNAKAYAAVAVLTLVRDGHMSLDDQISDYFPDVPSDKREITVHQLLTHTSGLPDEYERSYTSITRTDMETAILSQPLVFEPGSGFAYSDMGYALIQALVERVSDQPYQAYVESHVFDPYKLKNTGFIEAPMWAFNGGSARVARGYTNGEEKDSPINLPQRTWTPIGGGTILSTVHDGLLWHSGLISGDVLGDQLAKRIFEKHIERKDGVLWYGYGWSIVQSPTRGTVYVHSGATSSHNYYSQYLADHDIFVVTASNRIDGVYNDEDSSGTIEDDEIISEMIYAVEIGASVAKAIHAARSE